jgi:hypothetical protein
MTPPPVVLCFSGHDPSGGAGIQADIEAIASMGAHAAPCITAVTVQNTVNVREFMMLPTPLIRAQAEALFDDLPIAAVKLGMLGSIEVVEVIADLLMAHPGVHLVFDPVLVAGGGGRDAYPLIATALDAHSLIPRRKRPEMTVVAGPLMEKEVREQLERKAKAGDVRFLTSTTDFPALLNNTDLFVSMAGYNSVNECLASGRPAIFVPRVGPSSEQRLRAARVSELGLARILFHEELDAGLLAQMIQAPVEHTVPEQAIRFDGAGVAAQLIADQLAAKAMADRDNQTKGFAHVQ